MAATGLGGGLSVGRNRSVSVDELIEIHAQVREQARADRSIHYEDVEGRGPSIARLEAIVAAVPPLDAALEAAWVIRAIVLVQPFPGGNHRTALVAAELILERAGVRVRPTEDEVAAFQKEVSKRRYALLGGYEDAPLGVLRKWQDPVMECWHEFVRGKSSA